MTSEKQTQRSNQPGLRDAAGVGLPIKVKKPARHKVMDMIARRDHSELELRKKLKLNFCDAEVEDAIAYARENRWLAPPAELAARAAASLDRKRKGHRLIERFLREKGLPAVARDPSCELVKGLSLIQAQSRLLEGLGRDRSRDEFIRAKQKIQRVLTNRGFDSDAIRRVIDTLIKQR